MKKVFIIVPVFKRENLTESFINSILLQNSDFSIEFIVVDDDSDLYGNFTNLSQRNNVTCLKTHGDAWWCGTVRYGIDYFNSYVTCKEDDIIVIANNDVIVKDGELDKILKNVASNEICHPQTFTDKGEEISSGAKVISWFPFITIHPKFGWTSVSKVDIDLCPARFMCMYVSTLRKVGNVSENLVQYQGDYDLSLKAKRKNIELKIIKGAYCQVYDGDTGLKTHNIITLGQFISSFYETRSSNNLKYRWLFVRNHFNFFLSVLIFTSMFINIIARFIIMRFK